MKKEYIFDLYSAVLFDGAKIEELVFEICDGAVNVFWFRDRYNDKEKSVQEIINEWKDQKNEYK